MLYFKVNLGHLMHTTPDVELISFLRAATASGQPREATYGTLLQHGWSIDAIQAGERKLKAEAHAAETPARAIHVILTVAALLVAAGIFSFIAANWDDMSRPVKVGVILVTMVLAYVVSEIMLQNGYRKTSGAFLLLGALIYGAGIFLVAQTFHIRAHWPDGFLLWMLGVAAMAAVRGAYGLHMLALLLGFVGAVAYPAKLIGPWISRDVYLHTSTWLLAITLLTCAGVAVWLRWKVPHEVRERY